jgi:hypothetical protein
MVSSGIHSLLAHFTYHLVLHPTIYHLLQDCSVADKMELGKRLPLVVLRTQKTNSNWQGFINSVHSQHLLHELWLHAMCIIFHDIKQFNIDLALAAWCARRISHCINVSSFQVCPLWCKIEASFASQLTITWFWKCKSLSHRFGTEAVQWCVTT